MTNEQELMTLIDLRLIATPSGEDTENLEGVEEIIALLSSYGIESTYFAEAGKVATTSLVPVEKRLEIAEALDALDCTSAVEDELESYFMNLGQQVGQLFYQKHDSIYSIRLHPRDLDIYKEKLSQVLPPEFMETISFETDEALNMMPQITLRSQVETQWLADYFSRAGFFKYLQSKGCPIIPNAEELKMLYLQNAFREVQEKTPQIVPAGVNPLGIR